MAQASAVQPQNRPDSATRTAVVLLNLGGPDSLDAVEPFLFNLFSDPDIFRVPLARLTQKPFARIVSRRRAPEATKAYAAIGGKSPLLENTQAQAEALKRALASHGSYDVVPCMRYWHPRADVVVAALKRGGYARVILLPLYPQYSGTTTGSSVNDFMHACEREQYRPEIRTVRQWFETPAYLEGIRDTIRAAAARFPNPDPAHIELLFSAHGLPKKIVAAGDPYEEQIRATFLAVRNQLGFPHTTLCYQSRVGPLEWLQPYIADVIREKAAAGCQQLLVYPIAFVSDHSETLYELGIQYRDLARACGIAHYEVVPALNAHPLLIQALAELVLRHG
jgi:ferrochelatase